MGITAKTLYEWENRFSEIRDALKRGKAPVDFEVENALLKRALGFEYEEIMREVEDIPTNKTDSEGNTIYKQKKHVRKIKKYIPPEPTAMIFWLKNRKPEQWKDKREQVVSTKDGILADLISGLKEPQDDLHTEAETVDAPMAD